MAKFAGPAAPSTGTPLLSTTNPVAALLRE